MPGTPTPILGLILPTVGGDSFTWGSELLSDLALLDFLGAAGVSASSSGRTLAYGVSPVQRAYETGGAGGITDVLPTAVGHTGQGFLIKKVDAGAGAVQITTTTSSQTIQGASTYSLLVQWQFVWVESDGANWQIVASSTSSGGGFSGDYTITATSINYAIATTDEIVQCTGGAGGITVTLPSATSLLGATILIKKVDAGAGPVTVATTSSQTIEGNLTYVLSMRWQYIWVYSDGANWMIRGAN